VIDLTRTTRRKVRGCGLAVLNKPGDPLVMIEITIPRPIGLAQQVMAFFARLLHWEVEQSAADVLQYELQAHQAQALAIGIYRAAAAAAGAAGRPAEGRPS
jgi:hypothetical protein